jgi:sterol desaturase/sphingolipid hydroxylase (fatty acid hydroxylase superfamily)
MGWMDSNKSTKLYVSNKDESVRMFQSDFLEFFTKVHWSVPIFLYVPIILFLLYKSFTLELAWQIILLYFFLGLIIWTLTEYLLHRFLFHFHPKSVTMKKFFWTFHGVHHDYPQDSKRLVMPPSVSLPLAILFYFFFNFIIGNTNLFSFFAGFLTGYLFYDITHYAIHHFNFKSSIFKSLKDHHSIHHYKYENLGFGVSSPFWDYIFRTTFPEKVQNKL